MLTIIGHARTPWPEKFGVPRQPGLVPIPCRLEFPAAIVPADCFRGIETFSHIWVQFLFDQNPPGWKPLVRPPRLGGNRRMGVFASRSPFRPNPIGLSVVALRALRLEAKMTVLEVDGLDLTDGTPLLDIKPYLPWCDRIEEAQAGWASEAPRPRLQVEFTETALSTLRQQSNAANSEQLIRHTLEQDPRPAFHQASGRRYHTRIGDWSVYWQMLAQSELTEGERIARVVLIEAAAR